MECHATRRPLNTRSGNSAVAQFRWRRRTSAGGCARHVMSYGAINSTVRRRGRSTMCHHVHLVCRHVHASAHLSSQSSSQQSSLGTRCRRRRRRRADHRVLVSSCDARPRRPPRHHHRLVSSFSPGTLRGARVRTAVDARPGDRDLGRAVQVHLSRPTVERAPRRRTYRPPAV